MYIINPWWFYLIGVAEGIKTLFLTIGTIGGIAMILITFLLTVEANGAPKFGKPIIILCTIMIFIGTLIPNQKTCYAMAIASVATTENLDYAAGTGKNIVDYITEKAIELIKAGE